MDACSNTNCHETPTHDNHLPEPTPAGRQSGRIVTVAKPLENNLPQDSDTRQSNAPKGKTLFAASASEQANSRQILRERFNKIDNPEHFAHFCAMVERVYVQDRFHCTIDRLPVDEMKQIILEHHNALSDIVALTAGSAASEPGGSKQPLAETNQAAGSAKTGIHERLCALYPLCHDSTLKLLSSYLNRDCLQIKGCQLSELSDADLPSFSKNQIRARIGLQNNETRRRLDKEHLSEKDVLLLFSTHLPHPPRNKKPAERSGIPKRLYRLGTFTSNEDEMGRVKNHKLDRLIFKQNQVNQQQAKFGPGLYTTQDAAQCRIYCNKQYNRNKPLAILEMATARDINLVDYRSISGRDHQQPNDGSANQVRTIVKTAPGELLIKDPRCLVSTKAFHPSMTMKIHIPFTKEEIMTHQLQRKTITQTDFKQLNHTKTLHRCAIADTLGSEAGVRDVLECQVNITPERGSARGLASNRWHEIKFYAYSLKGKSLVQVKPAAPLNWIKTPTSPGTTYNHGLSIDYEFTEFHVQYHRLKQTARRQEKR